MNLPRRNAIFLVLWLALTGSGRADPSQWRQFYQRQEQENFRQSQRSLDYHYRYDPNPRSTPASLEPLRRQLTDWAASVEEARRRRAQDRHNQALVLVEFFRESQRRAEEQARQATLARWNALKQQAADGDFETSYRVARLIRWGQGRLPREQKTGDEPARPWYRFAAEKGHADAAYELALLLEKEAPADALRYFTKAANAGKREAILPAAELAADGVPGKLPPNPLEALRLYGLGAAADDAAVLTTGAYFLLRQPSVDAERMAQAIAWLERAAEREPAAAGKLAFLSLHDQPGRTQDHARAVRLARAALQKQPRQPDALLTLGAARIDGLGGEAKDGAGAVALLTQAADGGSLRACYVLAVAYHNGLGGLAKSDAAAARWRLAGAKLGHVQSMLELVVGYRTGVGVEKNAAEAARWLVAAATAGSVQAMLEVAGLMMAQDPHVKVGMNDLRAMAARAAHEGNVTAQELYASMWLDGFGGEKSDAEALAWFRRAAENDGRSGQYFLALHYREGVGVAPDVAEAYRWMRRAGEAGHGDACAQLAWHHATGTGCTQDVVVARDWARRGAEAGSVLARRSYGAYLGDGIGGARDGPEAIRQLTLAVEQNDDRSRLQLAQYLTAGLPDVPADRAAARRQLEAAARSRDREVAGQAQAALAALDQPKPVSLDGLRIAPAGKKAGDEKKKAPSIYDSLQIK